MLSQRLLEWIGAFFWHAELYAEGVCVLTILCSRMLLKGYIS